MKEREKAGKGVEGPKSVLEGGSGEDGEDGPIMQALPWPNVKSGSTLPQTASLNTDRLVHLDHRIRDIKGSA